MPQDNLPPLRVREADGSPNVIPVFDMIMSNNLTVQNRGGGIVAISATTGAGGGGSGASTANTYVVTDFTSDLNSEFRLVQSGNSITINTASNLIIINAVTGSIVSPGGSTDQFQYNSGSVFAGASGLTYIAGSISSLESHRFIGRANTGTLLMNRIELGAGQFVLEDSGNETFLLKSIGGALTLHASNQVMMSFEELNNGGFIGLRRNASNAAGLELWGSTETNATIVLYDTGGKHTNIRVPPMTETIIEFIFPTSQGAIGTVLANKGAGNLHWAASGGGGSSTVYAATGNDYVVMNLAGDLTNEYRLVQSGNSISVTTATGLITINASTGDLSVKQNTITYPLGVNSGGTGRIVAGSASSLVGINSAGLVYDFFYLKASDNITIVRVGTNVLISANTGAAGGSGTVNTGSANYLTFYKAADTNVYPSAIGTSTGSNLAPFNIQYLITDPSSNSGDLWLLASSASVFLRANSSGTTFNIGNFPVAANVTFMAQTSASWTNMPSADTEFMGNAQFRNLFHVANITSVNLSATTTVVGTANSYFTLKWSTNNGTTFDYVGNTGSSPATNIGTVGMRTSGWTRISTDMVGEVILAVFGSGGDGAIDPSFGNVSALFR